VEAGLEAGLRPLRRRSGRGRFWGRAGEREIE
jgi:hypothetical protein